MATRNYISVTSLADLLDQRAEAHPDRDAIAFPSERFTYRELADRVQATAKSLLAVGVDKGDRVGYFLHESIDTITTLMAAAKIGAIAVPVNSRFKSVELRKVIVHCGMKVILTSRPEGGTDFAALLQETFPGIGAGEEGKPLIVEDAPELRWVVVLEDRAPAGMVDRNTFLELGEAIDDASVLHRQRAVRVRDAAVIMYTSGTTAMPKGAMISHEAFARFADATVNVRGAVQEGDAVWTALPLFHIGGVAFAVATLYASGTYVHTGHYDPGVALRQLREEPCTVALPGFETIWLPVINHADRQAGDLDSLRVLLCVGVEERMRQMQAATPDATIIGCFGQTEATAFLSLSDLADPLDLRVSSGGFPMPGMEVEVHDPDTGKLLEEPATGELWYRGPMAFDGYYRDPETTAAVFDDRGFFRTGDVAHVDADGRVTFVSRVKDMLKVGGENVAAAEVEGYLVTHPDVAMAQVVAAPDARYVEVPAAYIMLKPGADVSEEEIIDFCRGKIATFRVPRYVRFVDEWPMSGTKVKKYVLREQIAAELEAAGITEAPRISST